MKSLLTYQGGKSRLAPIIIKKIPAHKCYVEPFCGACWVFLNKEPVPAEVLNDRDLELVTFWRVVQNHLTAFLEYYKYAITSREIFDLENKKDPATLTDIQRVTLKYSIGKSAASREKERAEVLIQNY
jgi:DNA adenine methylase